MYPPTTDESFIFMKLMHVFGLYNARQHYATLEDQVRFKKHLINLVKFALSCKVHEEDWRQAKFCLYLTRLELADLVKNHPDLASVY